MGQNQATQTYEIVCLEYQGDCLYAEVIQQVSNRQRSWLRPLALSLLKQTENSIHEESVIHDLRDCSDLLWPQSHLRAALDVELLPVLSLLQTEKSIIASAESSDANQHLHEFLRRVPLTSSESFTTT